MDATQQVFDESRPHLFAEITRVARDASGGRTLCIVGENEPQHAQLARARRTGGFGLDALWNDDFHHAAMVAATGRAEAYYSGYRGTAQEFVSCAKHGFLYQGQWFQWQKNRRGRPSFDLARDQYVVFLQNHDQIANSIRGERFHQLTSPGRFRALTGLLLLMPSVPLIFQGQEFGASSPFLFFADHRSELAKQVRAGRTTFLKQFSTLACEESTRELPDPGAEETFRRCKLDFGERSKNRRYYQLHEELLRLRRDDATIRHAVRVDGAVLNEHAFVLRYFSVEADDRILLVNLGSDFRFNPAPEPLLAPVENGGWRVIWSSESPTYGGAGTPPLETTAGWMIPGQAAVLMKPDENCKLPPAKLSEKD